MVIAKDCASKIGISIKTIPHPKPDDAYDLIAKMVVKSLITKSESEHQSTA